MRGRWLALALVALGLVAWPGAGRAQPATGGDAGAKFDALNQGLDAGVLSRAEYEAQITALLHAAPATGAPQDGFENVDVPEGGHIMAGPLGPQPSVAAAAGAALRHVHAMFGARPQPTRVLENPATQSAVLIFTAQRDGQPYTGMAMLNGVPGPQATAAVLYDTSPHFAASISPMLHRLLAMTGAADATAPVALAPAEPLHAVTFADGTGSMGLPADWRLLTGGGGTAGAVGPGGEFVGYNVVLTGMDPNNPKGSQYLRNMPPQMRQAQQRMMVVLPYSGDPVQSFVAAFQQLARQNGKPLPQLAVARQTPIGAGQGLHVAAIQGTGTLPGIPGKADDAPGVFLGYVQVTAPDLMGQWTLYTTLMFVPKATLAAQGQTALAVLGSVQINFQAVAGISAATRQMFQKQFEGMIASAQAQDAARAERSRQFLEHDQERQDQMHKQAVAMENYVLDRRVVVDTVTGAHGTFGNDFADVLVRIDPNFELVPPSRLLAGVDY